MAKRAVLEKMSNKELLQYFRPDTRFVAEALDLAYDILEKRNYPFAEQERSRIIHLIETKRDAERDLHLKSTWDIGEDAEKGQISFIPKLQYGYLVYFSEHLRDLFYWQ